MDFGNVNPVQRTSNAEVLRRDSHPNYRRRPASILFSDDNSETEQDAQDGNDTEENDRYQPLLDDESAILGEVTAEELRSPSMAAAQVLRSRGENDEYYG